MERHLPLGLRYIWNRSTAIQKRPDWSMNPIMADASLSDTPKPYPIYKIVIGRTVLAALIVLIGDWVAAPLLGFIAVAGLIMSLLNLKRNPSAVRVGIIKTAIYGTAAVVALIFHGSMQSQDREQAEMLVRKLEQYKQEHRAYPEKLAALTPALLPKIPRSRYGPYMYSLESDGSFRMTYVDLPPGGKCSYSSGSPGTGWECRAD